MLDEFISQNSRLIFLVSILFFPFFGFVNVVLSIPFAE